MIDDDGHVLEVFDERLEACRMARFEVITASESPPLPEFIQFSLRREAGDPA
jgi:hypothetical protein